MRDQTKHSADDRRGENVYEFIQHFLRPFILSSSCCVYARFSGGLSGLIFYLGYYNACKRGGFRKADRDSFYAAWTEFFYNFANADCVSGSNRSSSKYTDPFRQVVIADD